MRQMVNRRHHACGCVTEFDTEEWHSVVVRRCTTHQAVARRLGGEGD